MQYALFKYKEIEKKTELSFIDMLFPMKSVTTYIQVMVIYGY